MTTNTLRKRRALLLAALSIPNAMVRGSYVTQYLTCGKPNCRCCRGHKHGPFHYLVQTLGTGKVQKFLLKTPDQRGAARRSIKAYRDFQKRLEELSNINTKLLAKAESTDS